MSRTVYVNGQFVPEEEAVVSVFDRAFLFADGVYEVSSVLGGCLVDNEAHLNRLGRSLDELKMPHPCDNETIEALQKELIARNDLTEGVVYMQVTRGSADRDFGFPVDAKPTLVMFTQKKNVLKSPAAESGIRVVTTPDIRWRRRDIKTVGLLGPSLAKQASLEQGADDAWMVEDGYVTEGSSNNAYIVTQDGVIVTRQLSNDILHGITRAAVLELCEKRGLTVEQRPFTPEEAYRAREAFSTSASSFVMPVVEIDGKVIGNGKPGHIATELRQIYIEHALAQTQS